MGRGADARTLLYAAALLAFSVLPPPSAGHINTMYFVVRRWASAGSGWELLVEVEDPVDGLLLPADLEVVHASMLHVVVASEDLSYVVHTHPEWAEADAERANATVAAAGGGGGGTHLRPRQGTRLAHLPITLDEPPPAGWYHVSFDFSAAVSNTLLAAMLVALFDANLSLRLERGPETDALLAHTGAVFRDYIAPMRTVDSRTLARLLDAREAEASALWVSYAEYILHGGFTARVYFPAATPLHPNSSAFYTDAALQRIGCSAAVGGSDEQDDGQRDDEEEVLRSVVTHVGGGVVRNAAAVGEGCVGGGSGEAGAARRRCAVARRLRKGGEPRYVAVLETRGVDECGYPSVEGGPPEWWSLADPRLVPEDKRVAPFTRGVSVAVLRVYEVADTARASPVQLSPYLNAYGHVYVSPRAVAEFARFDHVHAMPTHAVSLPPRNADGTAWDCTKLLKQFSALPRNMPRPAPLFTSMAFVLNTSRPHEEAAVVAQVRVAATGAVITPVFDWEGDGSLAPVSEPVGDAAGCGCPDGWVRIDAVGGSVVCVRLSEEMGRGDDEGLCARFADGAFLAAFPDDDEQDAGGGGGAFGQRSGAVRRSLAGGYLEGTTGGTGWLSAATQAFVGARIAATDGNVSWVSGPGAGVDAGYDAHFAPGFRPYEWAAVSNCPFMGGTDSGLFAAYACRVKLRHLCMLTVACPPQPATSVPRTTRPETGAPQVETPLPSGSPVTGSPAVEVVPPGSTNPAAVVVPLVALIGYVGLWRECNNKQRQQRTGASRF